MKIGLYGGSFNPVHYGHLHVAETALEKLSLDRLLIIPAAVSPFKTAAPEGPPDAARVKLLKAVFGKLPRTEIDEREITRGGVSYAIDTVREIAAENPGAELIFLIGEDSAEGLPRWKAYEELKKLCRFEVFPRTKESSTALRELFAAAKVTVNPDREMYERVREGVLRKGGFCPCRLQKTPENFCPCEEFQAQLRDETFHGFCHCRMFYKP